MDPVKEVGLDAIRTVVPVGVGGALLFGISVNDWIIILTVGWLLWNYAEKLYAIWRKHVRKRKPPGGASPRPGGGSDQTPD